jgi:membrane protein YdbS with pleckstrin-like domain
MNAANLKRRSTAKGIPFLLLGVAVIIAVAVFIILNPDILKNILYIVLLLVAVAVAVIIVILAVIMILAIPFYLFKGEQYQEGGSYDIKDVKSVKESSSEEEDGKQ